MIKIPAPVSDLIARLKASVQAMRAVAERGRQSVHAVAWSAAECCRAWLRPKASLLGWRPVIFDFAVGARLPGLARRCWKGAVLSGVSLLAGALLAFALLDGQATAQKPPETPSIQPPSAAAVKPPPSLITGQPNAQQPQPAGAPPAAAVTPAAAPNAATQPPQPPAGASPGQQMVQTARPAVPSLEVVTMLVRGTLIAFNDANLSGNYDVLHALAAPSFQHDVDVAKLSENFKAFREHQIDLSAVAVLAPRFVKPPELDKDGLLRVAGFFPSQPLQLSFSIAYQTIDGHWRYAAFAAAAQPAPTPPAAQASPAPQPPGAAATPTAGGTATPGPASPQAAVPAAQPEEKKPVVAATPMPKPRREHLSGGLPPATTHW